MHRFISVGVALCFLIGSVGCGQKNEAKENSASLPHKQVKVAKAISSILPRSVAVSGTLAAEEEVVLSMKVPGRVQAVYVDLGSPLKRGQPLVRLEPADFQLRVKQAEAAYQQARVRLGLQADGNESGVDLNPEDTGVVRQAKALLEEAKLTRTRMETLHKDGFVPRSQLDDATAQFQVADARYQDAIEEVRSRQALLIQRRAEFDIARKQLSDSVLSSPLDGVIQEKNVSAGQFVSAGDAVLKMVRMHPLRLKLPVPERDAGNVRVGQKVDVRVEGDLRTYVGQLARVSPAISADNRTLMVEAEISNEQGLLRPGSFARAEIITESQDPVVLIPDSSVITFAGLTKVISVENNETQEKRVKLGRKTKGAVEVLEGVNAGESVVINPKNLTGGEKVVPVW
jgi:membrane fusion protein, multidrug efflux system